VPLECGSACDHVLLLLFVLRQQGCAVESVEEVHHHCPAGTVCPGSIELHLHFEATQLQGPSTGDIFWHVGCRDFHPDVHKLLHSRLRTARQEEARTESPLSWEVI